LSPTAAEVAKRSKCSRGRLTAMAKVRAKYPRFPDDLVHKYARYLVASQRSDKNRDVLTGELVADLLASAPTWRAKLRVLCAIITGR
jgi:hypothetical protein